MNKKAINIINWVLGITLCSLGVSLCTKAALGLSMIAAPPYIIHYFIRDILPWYTQGTSEYIWETVLLVLTCISIQRFKLKYLLSFLTAVLSGLIIDFWLMILGGNGMYNSMAIRIIAFAVGSVIISIAIAFVFRTTWPPQVYELLVSEISERYNIDKSKTKWVNDIVMLAISVILSRVLTHSWTGVGIGTIIVTIVNAPLISFFGKIIDKIEK